MTLGGLALAVGILVDDATVEIENINRNLAQGKETVRAILDGAQQIAVPAFVSTLVHLHRVRAHVFPDGRREIPVRAAGRSGRLRHAGVLPAFADAGADHGDVSAQAATTAKNMPPATISFRAFSAGSRTASSACGSATVRALAFLPGSRLDVRSSVSCCFASHPRLSPWFWGADFFPSVDAGLIRLHMRARAGQRVEETARECDRVDNLIRRVIPTEELGTVLDNIGLPNST